MVTRIASLGKGGCFLSCRKDDNVLGCSSLKVFFMYNFEIYDYGKKKRF